MKVRDRLMRWRRRTSAPATKPPKAPKALPEGPDEDVGDDAGFLAEAAPGRAEDAEGVGLVDDQGRVVLGGEGGEVAEGGAVAVHAEEGFGDEEAAAEASGGPQGVAGRRAGRDGG